MQARPPLPRVRQWRRQDAVSDGMHATWNCFRAIWDCKRETCHCTLATPNCTRGRSIRNDATQYCIVAGADRQQCRKWVHACGPNRQVCSKYLHRCRPGAAPLQAIRASLQKMSASLHKSTATMQKRRASMPQQPATVQNPVTKVSPLQSVLQPGWSAAQTGGHRLHGMFARGQFLPARVPLSPLRAGRPAAAWHRMLGTVPSTYASTHRAQGVVGAAGGTLAVGLS
jgi:hypothetical protein